MRIGSHRTMPGKVFAHTRHACLMHAALVSQCKFSDRFRITVESTITDDCRNTPIKVQYWRKTQIDTHRQNFTRHQPAGFTGCLQSTRTVFIIEHPETTHRRQPKEAVTKTLHTAAFLIDCYHQWWLPDGVQLLSQCASPAPAIRSYG